MKRFFLATVFLCLSCTNSSPIVYSKSTYLPSAYLTFPFGIQVVSSHASHDAVFLGSVKPRRADPEKSSFDTRCAFQEPVNLRFLGMLDNETYIAKYWTSKDESSTDIQFKSVYCESNSFVFVERNFVNEFISQQITYQEKLFEKSDIEKIRKDKVKKVLQSSQTNK